MRIVRENPFVLLCVALTGLIAWMAIDLLAPSPARSKRPVPESDPIDVASPMFAGAPAAGVEQPMSVTDLQPVSSSVLPKLRPGMKRVEVEGLLGPPSADRVHPVTVIDGRATYRTAYELEEFGVPPTIRPIQKMTRVLPPSTSGPTIIVALEFDASSPGHPLVEIVYSDPLF